MTFVKYPSGLVVKVPKDHKTEFKHDLAQINFFRLRNLSLLVLAAACFLIYTDLTAEKQGLWQQTVGYRWLFYSHIIIVVTLFSMLLISWLKKLYLSQETTSWLNFFTLFLSVFATLLGAGTSINDQFIHGEVTVYVLTSLIIAVTVYLRPLTSFIIYAIAHSVFIIGITLVQNDYNILRGHYINGTLVVILSWFLSVVLYNMKAKDFLKKKTIEHQKFELELANLELTGANEQLQLSLRALDETQNMIFSLALALESKDPYTHGHSQRVADYSLEIARHLNLSEKLQEDLWRAAILHDIGKIGIPDAILNKPGRLTSEEWPIMKSHPERGENICSKLNFAREILPIIRHHHERYEGGGYPDSIAGEQIPYLARIISIADAVDAITSKRSYRAPRSFEIAISELSNGTGTQFDPELVQAFVDLYALGKLKPYEETASALDQVNT